MSNSRALVFSVLLSGLVFSSATLLLVATGSRPITIEVEERPLFTGRVQDLATPYLSIATGLSLGMGLTALALLGWKDASRRLDRATQQVSILKQQLQHQEGMVESLKFSEAKLQATGLKFFLDAVSDSASLQPAPFHPVVQSAASISPVHSVEQVPPPTVQSITPVQAQRVEPLLSNHSQSNHHAPQIEELKTALSQIMNQIEQLQGDAPGHGTSVDASVRI